MIRLPMNLDVLQTWTVITDSPDGCHGGVGCFRCDEGLDDIRQGLLRVIEIIESEKCHKGREEGDEQAQVQRRFGRGICSD